MLAISFLKKLFLMLRSSLPFLVWWEFVLQMLSIVIWFLWTYWYCHIFSLLKWWIVILDFLTLKSLAYAGQTLLDHHVLPCYYIAEFNLIFCWRFLHLYERYWSVSSSDEKQFGFIDFPFHFSFNHFLFLSLFHSSTYFEHNLFLFILSS